MRKITIFNVCNYLAHKTGYDLKHIIPRTSTLFAKEHFKGKKIEAMEIGVYKGENSLNILKELNVRTLLLIDPYKIEEGDLNELLEDTPEKWNEEAYYRLLKYKDKCQWLLMTSTEALNHIKEKFDFIYIDGNHKYKNVLEDLENYYPLVNEGGIIAGHDMNYFDTARAVIHFCDKYNLKAKFDFPDWYIIK